MRILILSLVLMVNTAFAETDKQAPAPAPNQSAPAQPVRRFPSLYALGFALAPVATLLSTAAEAGIRGITGGGGLAEMQALSLLARLHRLLAPCVLRPELCPSHRVAGLLEKLEDAGELNTHGSRLSFTMDPLEDGVVFASANDHYFQIYTPFIYTDQNRPRSLEEIAAVVIYAWMMRPAIRPHFEQSGLSWEEFSQAISEIVRGVSSHEVLAQWGAEQVHVLRLRMGDSVEHLVTLENGQRSVEITEQITSAVRCPGATLTHLDRLSVLDDRLHGRLRWQCGEQSFEGRMIVSRSAAQHFAAQVGAVRPFTCASAMEARK